MLYPLSYRGYFFSLYGILFAKAMGMEDLRNWIALHRALWAHPNSAWDMVLRAGSVGGLLHLPRQDLCTISDIEWPIIEQLRAIIDWRQADRDLALIDAKEIIITPRGSPQYPPLLAQITDPPIVLFWRGSRESISATGTTDCVAVVGSRKATNYGREAIDTIIPGLVAAGRIIVSGLAFGIDAHAHRACIAARGHTIAVLASGVDDITPRQHQSLGELIMKNGALCSEFPIGTPSYASHFLYRNRIISGLSHATLVVEAEIKSGSLVTARHAADQGRDVFAVPGPITAPLSAGCHQLLKEGASPCTEFGDILGASIYRGAKDENSGHSKALDDTSARLFETLSTGPCTANQLGDRLQMPIAQVLQLVTTLECAGMLHVLPGGFVARK